jgi:hypothetical protein
LPTFSAASQSSSGALLTSPTWLQENVGQLIGEAAHLEANCETFAIPREVWADATEKQEAARSESSTEILLDEWFAETTMTPVAYVTAADLEHLSTIGQCAATTQRVARA